MVKQLSVWSGDHWIGQKRLIWGPLRMVPMLPLSAEMRGKNFFVSNGYISGTKWLRHQKWVLNWRFLQELYCKFFFELVTPSRSSGKDEKARGQICPPWVLKGPKVLGLIGLIIIITGVSVKLDFGGTALSETVCTKAFSHSPPIFPPQLQDKSTCFILNYLKVYLGIQESR